MILKHCDKKEATLMAKRTHSMPSLLHAPAGGSLPGFLWNYIPRTSWFTHFITINNNRNDAPIEEHVLSDVGSYGLQLGQILDALDVLIALVPTVDRNTLSNEDIAKLADLTTLHKKVKAVVDQYA
jgi:hypothetical protein